MTRTIAIAALVLLSLGGCVIVPYGWGHQHHGWQDGGRYHDHYHDYRR
jgi:hypothetical protein